MLLDPSYALSTGSESLDASNTSSSHLPTQFLRLPNLHTFITSSLFSVLAVLALHRVVTLVRPLTSSSLKITDCFFHYVAGINSIYFFVDLILVSVPLFPTRLFLHLLLYPILIHHCSSVTPSLSLPAYNLPVSQILPRSFISYSWTAFTDYYPDRFF